MSLSNACTLLNYHQCENALARLQVYYSVQLNYTGVKKCALKNTRTLSDVSQSCWGSICLFIRIIYWRRAKLESSRCLPGCVSWHYESHWTSKCSTLPKCPGLLLWLVPSPSAWFDFFFFFLPHSDLILLGLCCDLVISISRMHVPSWPQMLDEICMAAACWCKSLAVDL